MADEHPARLAPCKQSKERQRRHGSKCQGVAAASLLGTAAARRDTGAGRGGVLSWTRGAVRCCSRPCLVLILHSSGAADGPGNRVTDSL